MVEIVKHEHLERLRVRGSSSLASTEDNKQKSDPSNKLFLLLLVVPHPKARIKGREKEKETTKQGKSCTQPDALHRPEPVINDQVWPNRLGKI